MTDKSLFYHSSLSYLNQWYVIDRHFINILSSSSDGEALSECLRKLSAEYRVARNFTMSRATTNDFEKQAQPLSKQTDDGKKLARQLWMRVASLVQCAAEEHENDATKTVAILADSLGKVFPGKDKSAKPTLLSAASKFLWFSGRYDIRIYDSRATLALNAWCKEHRATDRRGWRVDGSYSDFAKEWGRMYETFKRSIGTVVNELELAMHWSLVPGNDQDSARSAMQQQWFHDRVFDKYLWTVGTSLGQRRSSPVQG